VRRPTLWWARRAEPAHDVAFVSDGLIPFRDNVDEAARHGVTWIAERGGSIRSGEVSEACAEYGIGHVQTGRRLFRH
jgi:phosphoribosylaminoimidazolecarboxamide formyltransferase/IMP cyclohydrolase